MSKPDEVFVIVFLSKNVSASSGRANCSSKENDNEKTAYDATSNPIILNELEKADKLIKNVPQS